MILGNFFDFIWVGLDGFVCFHRNLLLDGKLRAGKMVMEV